MRILHLSTFDLRGGAPRAAYRLNSGLRKLGHDSTMLVAQGDRNDPAVKVFSPPTDLSSRVRRRIRSELINWNRRRYPSPGRNGFERFSDDRTAYNDSLLEQLPSADVINLHWITDFVDYQAFFAAIAPHVPLVWTIHDMNPFTGGCHYDAGCGKYADDCGACPQLGSRKQDDLSRRVWQRKRDSIAQIPPGRLHIVTPSQWMANDVKCGSLMQEFPVTVIPNGVDTDDFAPRDRGHARTVLGIPEHAYVILFAANKNVKRKGFSLLAEALSGLDEIPGLLLLSLGSDTPVIETSTPHIHLGYTGNDRLLSLVYSAADVFVVPSLQDNLPNTVLESFACGTPVLAFDVGGLPDIVSPGVTGLLVPAPNVAALRSAIIEVLQEDQKRIEMGISCRRIAVDEYSSEKQAQRYLRIYQTLLDERSRITS